MTTGAGSPFRVLLGSLSRSRRHELAALSALMPATAVAEAISVAAIVPFIAALTGGTAVPSDVPMFGAFIAVSENVTGLSSLAVSAAFFGISIISTALLRLALSRTSQQFAFGAGHELAVDIQRRLLYQPYSFHLHRNSSEALASLDKVDHLVFNFLLQAIQALSGIMVSFFLIGLLLAIQPLIAGLAFLLVGGLFSLAFVAARRGFAAHAEQINSGYELRLRTVQESMGAIRDIILDRSQEAQARRFREIDRDFMQARARTAQQMAAPRIVVEAAGLLAVAALAILVAGLSGGMGVALPLLGALALGAYRLLPFMGQIYGAWAHLSSSRPIMADVANMLSLPLPDNDPRTEPLPFSHDIRFDRVSFLYPDRVHHALHDISFAIAKGSRVAVTGQTGSGKSTMADLLMGLIEPSEGRILVDGEELKSSLLPAWRKAIAHVPQSIFLADASIASNIALAFDGSELDLEGVRRAARLAQLDQFAEALPDGYDTRVGENGVLLSGGQRQRLALARALYKQAPVLVLDEATSALDEETEAALIAALDELSDAGCTIIIVAHRASTIGTCDHLLTLRDGALVDWARPIPCTDRKVETASGG